MGVSYHQCTMYGVLLQDHGGDDEVIKRFLRQNGYADDKIEEVFEQMYEDGQEVFGDVLGITAEFVGAGDYLNTGIGFGAPDGKVTKEMKEAWAREFPNTQATIFGFTLHL